MIKVEQVRKIFGTTRALDGFSVEVPKGALFGLVGPNGAGKTTLIRILATLLGPDGGRAEVAGADVTRDPEQVRAACGYLPDFAGVYSDMGVREYLEFFADAFRLSGDEKQTAIDKALEESGLRERAESYVEELSLGMKQRLTLAKTLLHRPQVLLLDEPATGLDPMARIEFREHMKALHRQGVTMLISSHILTDLEDICTDVAFISAGRNAADAQGRSVIQLAQTAAAALQCEVGFLDDAAAATAAATAAGARVVASEAKSMLLELGDGEEQAAAVLRQLVAAGVRVVRFAPHGPGLERAYRHFIRGGER